MREEADLAPSPRQVLLLRNDEGLASYDLLAKGRCGAVPPSATWQVRPWPAPDNVGEWASPPGYDSRTRFYEDSPVQTWKHRYALVLKWGGSVVREGRDCATYRLLDAAQINPSGREAAAVWRAAHTGDWTSEVLRALGLEHPRDDLVHEIDCGRHRDDPAYLLGLVVVERGLAASVLTPTEEEILVR